jgi:transmembrane secretion effector
MPSWARGRMNAIVIMAAQGAVALGGLTWGSSAAMWGTIPTLVGAAAFLLASLVLVLFLSIDFTSKLDFDPAPISGASHKLIHVPQPHDGPVSITIEFEVDRMRGGEFLDTLREVRLIHLRNGAFSWRLHEDLGGLNTYRVELTVPSWTEYLLEQERLTKSDKDVIDKAWALHIGENRTTVRHFLCVNRELHTRYHPMKRPSAMPEALSVEGATPSPAA